MPGILSEFKIPMPSKDWQEEQRRRSQEASTRLKHLASPGGYPMHEIFTENLQRVPEKFSENPHLAEGRNIFTDPSKAEFWGKVLNHRNRLYDANAQELSEKDKYDFLRHCCALVMLRWFTFEEICRYYIGDIIQKDFTDELFGRRYKIDDWRAEEKYAPIPKIGSINRWEIIQRIRLSLWRNGCGSGWNPIVSAYQSLPQFDFGLPNFETKIDWVWWFNCRGSTIGTRRTDQRDFYSDGAFVYCIHYKGEWVMSIGFSLAKDYRVLITQIQLRKPKGNRWLYKIPGSHLDWCVQKMFEAFSDWEICLVDGISLTDLYKKEYKKAHDDEVARRKERCKKEPDYRQGEPLPKLFSEENAKRLIRFYNKPLDNFDRGEIISKHYNDKPVKYYPLTAKKND